MARPEITGRKFISKRAVAVRYGIVPRTVDRWTKAGFLPPSDMVVNHRHYWDEEGLEQHDRERTKHAATAA